MFLTSRVSSANLKTTNENTQVKTANTVNWSSSDYNPEERPKQEMSMHFHIKNQKKFTHLYQLEKYFK